MDVRLYLSCLASVRPVFRFRSRPPSNPVSRTPTARARALSGTAVWGFLRRAGWSLAPAAGAGPTVRWSALQESGARPPFKKIDDAVRLPPPGVLSSAIPSSGRLSIPAAPHCVVLQRWRWSGLHAGRRAGASEVTCAARSSAASSLSHVWQSALGLFLGPPGIWISSSGGKKVAGPGLEPTTLGSSTQHLNHSDTGPRCFEGFHFHSLECAWRFLQPGAGGGRRSAAAARATSNSPKSKWRSAALEGGSLERTPRRVLAAPRGALRTARCSTWGGAQCRFFSGCGGFHAGGWRGLHDAGSPTLVVWPSPAGMGVRSPLGCRMGFSAGPVALSRSRGPSSRNGLT